VVEGMGSLGAAVATLAKPETWEAAGRGLEAAIADPGGSALAVADAAVDQGKAIVENASAVISDPGNAIAQLNDNPRAMGRMLGQAAGDLALAKLGNDLKARQGGTAAEQAGATKGGLGDTCSFSADTPVATVRGAQPIGTLHRGDHVLAWDAATGTTASYTVTAVLTHRDPLLIALTLDDERIETTPEHPFFTAAHGWVRADGLRIGERVRRLGGGSGVVRRVEVVQRPQVMYNLTVAVAHTFFVGAGRWLVHNICNPFKGKTSEEVDQMFRDKGFEPRGPDPVNGKGGYVNSATGRSYHIDKANRYGEPPHVDVNRLRSYKGPLPKRKYPME
jgi:hypothetical protein